MKTEDFYNFLVYSLTRIPQWGHSRTLISILDRFELTIFLDRNSLPKQDFEVEKNFIAVKRKFEYKECEPAIFLRIKRMLIMAKI